MRRNIQIKISLCARARTRKEMNMGHGMHLIKGDASQFDLLFFTHFEVDCGEGSKQQRRANSYP